MRRRLALVAFILIAAASINISMLRTATVERDRVRELQAVYGVWPGYDEFLAGVRRATKPGDSIAILVPSQQWDAGYGAGYLRAVYKLTGREVVPVVGPDNRFFPAAIERAAYVAVWRGRIADTKRQVIWSGHEGQLLR